MRNDDSTNFYVGYLLIFNWESNIEKCLVPILFLSTDLSIHLETPQIVKIKNAEKQMEKKRLKNPVYLVKHYMMFSSVHGMRYIIDPKLYRIEKIV